MSKTFNQVKLNVNFTAISPSSNMSNIESDDNISETFAKIHHWYVKTNGFQASASPLVSTSSSGTVALANNSSQSGYALSSHTHSYIPLGGSSSITGNLTPSTTNSISLGTSSKYWSNLYVNNINGSPLYEAITLSLMSGAKFSIKYEAYKIFGKFIYIDMDATATENITGATMGTSYGIAKVANGTTTNKIWNDASSVGVAYHNGSNLAYEIKAWVNTAGEVRVNANSTAINKGSIIKFKIMYPTA